MRSRITFLFVAVVTALGLLVNPGAASARSHRAPTLALTSHRTRHVISGRKLKVTMRFSHVRKSDHLGLQVHRKRGWRTAGKVRFGRFAHRARIRVTAQTVAAGKVARRLLRPTYSRVAGSGFSHSLRLKKDQTVSWSAPHVGCAGRPGNETGFSETGYNYLESDPEISLNEGSDWLASMSFVFAWDSATASDNYTFTGTGNYGGSVPAPCKRMNRGSRSSAKHHSS